MTVVRVAVYPIDGRLVDELQRAVDREFIPSLRQQEGFRSMSFSCAGDEAVSVSRWESRAHADRGSQAALDWALRQTAFTGPPTSIRFADEINCA
ncbi:MAG: hypothetical protein JWR85_319 [Marmoricola sp.]|nr:hypothetical protein [Marmoricola sp.]